MFLIRLIREAVIVYAVLLLVSFLLPRIASERWKWMDVLDQICAPGVQVGKRLAELLLPGRSFRIDVAPLLALLLCWVIQWVLSWFL